ncbi:PREDICTED: uncharacterized protein LOC102854789 [Elephantulus edwardii]|uniref:uncharacterized protein LOC102854789 n=1 Tax=Elephantulus edwardii TaxID=28737 RepID=UPI0003F0E47F|nr:PREDICTED: uncharacterized protein LOC102854789 [Elephantulus edwardii]
MAIVGVGQAPASHTHTTACHGRLASHEPSLGGQEATRTGCPSVDAQQAHLTPPTWVSKGPSSLSEESPSELGIIQRKSYTRRRCEVDSEAPPGPRQPIGQLEDTPTDHMPTHVALTTCTHLDQPWQLGCRAGRRNIHQSSPPRLAHFTTTTCQLGMRPAASVAARHCLPSLLAAAGEEAGGSSQKEGEQMALEEWSLGAEERGRTRGPFGGGTLSFLRARSVAKREYQAGPLSGRCPECPEPREASVTLGAWCSAAGGDAGEWAAWGVPTTAHQDQGLLTTTSILPPAMPASCWAHGPHPQLWTLLLLTSFLHVQCGGFGAGLLQRARQLPDGSGGTFSEVNTGKHRATPRNTAQVTRHRASEVPGTGRHLHTRPGPAQRWARTCAPGPPPPLTVWGGSVGGCHRPSISEKKASGGSPLRLCDELRCGVEKQEGKEGSQTTVGDRPLPGTERPSRQLPKSWCLQALCTWDDPTCTDGVVSVSQGERAVLTCIIANSFTHETYSSPDSEVSLTNLLLLTPTPLPTAAADACFPGSPLAWDDPTCTDGVVSVSQGERAVLTCIIANSFTHVNVSQCSSQDNCQQILTLDSSLESLPQSKSVVSGPTALFLLAVVILLGCIIWYWHCTRPRGRKPLLLLLTITPGVAWMGVQVSVLVLRTSLTLWPLSRFHVPTSLCMSPDTAFCPQRAAAVSMAPQHPWIPVLLALTLTLPGSLDAHGVQQSPRYVVTSEGSSINITCSSGLSKGFHLFREGPPEAKVMYYQDGVKSTVDQMFLSRVTFKGSQQKLTVTMHHLQPADSGVYICKTITEYREELGCGTLVLVTGHADSSPTGQLRPIDLSAALAIACFLLGLGLGVLCTLRRTQIKTLCWKKGRPEAVVVYEDMSCNTLSCPNPYQELTCTSQRTGHGGTFTQQGPGCKELQAQLVAMG